MNRHGITSRPPATPPADDPRRRSKLARPDTDENLPHIGLMGDTYTLLLSGEDTDGRYCLIDMHVPPGGGPPAHRHDFEETFMLLVGEIEATCRGEEVTVAARLIPPPKLDQVAEDAGIRKLAALAPKYQTELLK